MLPRDPTYRDQVDPITADKRGRVVPHTTLRKRVIDLSVARVDEPFRLEGDFLFADRDTTGAASIRLNSVAEDAWPLAAQDGVVDLPIRDVFVTNAAQAGKVLNLWYGYRARFLAGANSIASIGSILSPVDINYRTLAGDDEVTAGGAFMRGHELAASAGNSGHHQIKNPAGSGKVVLIDKLVMFATGGNQRWVFGRRDADLATLVGTLYSKNVGSPDSTAELRVQNNAASLLTNQMGWLVSISATVVEHVFSPAVRLEAGEGFCVLGATVNVDSYSTWRVREY